MVSWVVMTVDPKKLMNEWAKKNTATPMEPKTTAIHPAFNRGRLFACSSSLVRNFQPCRLVAWQNCWKQPEDVDIVGTSPLSLPPISHIDSNVSSDSLMMGQCGIKSLKSKLGLYKRSETRNRKSLAFIEFSHLSCSAFGSPICEENR